MASRKMIRCEGSAQERGFAHGNIAKELIHKNMETYRKLFSTRYDLEWKEARSRAQEFVPAIKEFDPELHDELRSIAQGAEVEFLDTVLLNARSAVVYSRTDECTSVAYIPSSDEAGRALIGQNWDNMKRLESVVLSVKQPGKPEVLTLTEAGTLAKIGLNSEGIGLCVNGLSVKGAPACATVPIFVMIRKALQAPNLSAAIGVITGTPKDAPHNYLLASKQGAAFDIEALYEDSDILTPSGRFLVHTNHLLSPRLMIRDELKAEIPDTVIRLWRAQRLLADQRGVFGVSEMKTLLSDHFDAPDSICRHGVTDEGGFETITKCSVIMELAEGRLHVSEGYPCDTPFETFEFV